jgi:arylsulfatase A-like enzyme
VRPPAPLRAARRRRTINFPSSLCAIGLLAALAAATARADTPRSTDTPICAPLPNIVVILADDLGYADLACCGAIDLHTPHIDRLAREGLRFTSFYANCSVCSPTRAALLSGCYPELVGVPGVIRTHPDDNWGWLAPDAVLLPALLRPAGHHTAIIGKWHLGLESPNLPRERGFDHFRGFLGDMMDDYFHHRRHDINYLRDGEREIDPQGHATDLFTHWACEYLHARQSLPEPFFLYLAYNAPHTPIQPPDDWLTRVSQRAPDLPEPRAKLVALIEHMDHGVGRVLETLDSTGLAESTLVVFTSDNGGQLNVGANNGPLRDGKQSMYEGGLKVPAIVRWPGRVSPGTTTDFRVLSMDLCPTLLAAAGIAPPASLDGVSFLPTLEGRTQEPLRKDWFFHRREGGRPYGGKTIDAVIRGDWKLLQNSPFAPQELYNLRDDPREQTDLAARERAVFGDLAAALRRHIQRGGQVPWQRPRDD